MELKSQDGALLELRPIRYQYPSATPGGRSRDWDANWLVIRGNVTMADGQSWCFDDPCLTTWEAREIIAWMRNVVSGRVKPSLLCSPDGQLGVYSLGGLSFTEPNLAFSVEDYIANHQIRLRIYFSIELCPPWLRASTQPRNFEFFIVFQVENMQLQHAAGQWETDLMPFPER